MFNGFTKEQLLIHKPKILIDILATEVARTNAALAAVSEELKNLREQRNGYTQALEEKIIKDQITG